MTISLDEASAEIESVEIYDIMGRKHASKLYAGSPYFMELNISGLSEEVYIVRILKNDGSFETSNIVLKLKTRLKS